MSSAILGLLILGGVGAGFVNTLAGGGSLLTLPLLIFAGLDAAAANGTNRVAILLQALVASWEFGRGGMLPIRSTARLVAPAAAGAALGALLAVRLPEPMLRGIIGVVLVLALPAVLRPRGRGGAGGGRAIGEAAAAAAAGGAGGRAEGRVDGGATGIAGGSSRPGRRPRPIILPLVLFACGLYGGFLQAGAGFLLLAVLVPRVGLDLVRANAVKNLLILLYTLLALPVFVLSGQVHLAHGLVLAIGTAAGARLASRLALRRGAGAVRWVLAGALVLAAGALLDLPGRMGIGSR